MKKMRVAWIPRPHKDKTYKYPFIVHSYRNDQGKPRTEIIMNLHGLPDHVINAIDKALLYGENPEMVPVEQVRFENSVNFGHAWAVWRLMQQLGIVEQLDRLPRKHRHAIAAMIMDRVLNPLPFSKRALHDDWQQDSPLARLMGVSQAGDLSNWYEALEALLEKQPDIEKALLGKCSGQIFLYDITSSYFEGKCCPIAAYGYNRDGKKGKLQIVIGLLTDAEGRPLAVRVFEGNTSDQTTVMDQIDSLRDVFGIKEVVFVGDRGMITSKRIEELNIEDYEWARYITALQRSEMMDRVDDQEHPIQIGLFDVKSLVEVRDGNKRYILCFNPHRKDQDAETRARLMEKTEKKLSSIRNNVRGGRLKNKDKINKRLYRWINRWGMERFFDVEADEGKFTFKRNEEQIERYSRLDGCYVITSNVEPERMETGEVVGRYKSLQRVERAFRSMKTADLFVRPIRHWNTERVKGHVFMCTLAYLVTWQARRRLSDFLERDPVTSECEGGSLREIWKTLNEVKIGVLKVGQKSIEQLNPLTNYQKRLLKALGASLNKKQLEHLSLRI